MGVLQTSKQHLAFLTVNAKFMACSGYTQAHRIGRETEQQNPTQQRRRQRRQQRSASEGAPLAAAGLVAKPPSWHISA